VVTEFLAAVAVIIAAVVGFAFGFKEGKRITREELEEANRRVQEKRDKLRRIIDQMDDDHVRDELNNWLRD
jgi:membrane protein DedA with SNARE-associated domain